MEPAGFGVPRQFENFPDFGLTRPVATPSISNKLFAIASLSANERSPPLPNFTVNRRAAFQPVNAIFPRHIAPVVRYSADGERELVLMTWGFMRLQEGRAPRPVTNVRDDQIQTNPFWRESFRQRRCLVPASSFCEPNGHVKPATWHWFAIKGDPPLFFPGSGGGTAGRSRKMVPTSISRPIRS